MPPGSSPATGPPAWTRAPAEVPIATRLCEHLVAAADRTLVTLGSRPAATLRAAGRAVEGLFAAAGARGDGTLAERLARGWRTDAHDDLRAALVLCADHELNVSSFTARCVASADARLEHVLLAALCALRGRRHGGLLERVEDLLDQVDRDGARAAADRAMGDGADLPGFGHPLYPDGDPRGAELLARAGPAGGVADLVDPGARGAGPSAHPRPRPRRAGAGARPAARAAPSRSSPSAARPAGWPTRARHGPTSASSGRAHATSGSRRVESAWGSICPFRCPHRRSRCAGPGALVGQEPLSLRDRGLVEIDPVDRDLGVTAGDRDARPAEPARDVGDARGGIAV